MSRPATTRSPVGPPGRIPTNGAACNMVRPAAQTTAILPTLPAPAGPGPAPDEQDLVFTPDGSGYLVTGSRRDGTGAALPVSP